MNLRTFSCTSFCLGAALVLLAAPARAAKKGAPAAPAAPPLSEAGEKLAAGYAATLDSIKQEVIKAIPALSEEQKAAYQKALAAEVAANEAITAVEQRLAVFKKATGAISHAQGKWIGGADKGIAMAKDNLAHAKTDEERAAAQASLAQWEDNRAKGVAALEAAQATLEQARKDDPNAEKDLEAAKSAHRKAVDEVVAAVKAIGLQDLLSRSTLDAKLARFFVLTEATPKGLAAYAQQGKEQEERIARLLAADALLIQMALANGAEQGRYGPAMEIYEAIQKLDSGAASGMHQRLALAIALEHAVPIEQSNAAADTSAPATVDPVKRYAHYKKAFADNQLDAGFKDLSVWDYRMVVDGNEPDEILGWGRQMLANYRPDHIITKDARWRYVAVVRTDVRYGSQDNQFDEERLQSYQNILKNGGVCGRRAFMGRFILRAFGVPTIARPQRGHAALAHWTPDGWVVCLGAAWGNGFVNSEVKSDLDFLAITQARAAGDDYLQVKRAFWIGDVMGEPRCYGIREGQPAFWNGVALNVQRGLIAKASVMGAVGTDIGEANVTKEQVDVIRVELDAADKTVATAADGTLTIPATATTQPAAATSKILFMPSNLGGKQMVYERNGDEQSFEYTVEVPAEGKYVLTARVVTPSWQQKLSLQINDSAQPVVIALPYTVGMWGATEPVTVTLAKGRNVLRFTHGSDGQAKGFSIRDFTLKPVR